MNAQNGATVDYPKSIRARGITIYDVAQVDDANLWIPTAELERLLNRGLSGMSVGGLPLRTRSKEVKKRICSTLGYPEPRSFKRTSPAFSGQRFDVYVQKSDNLQVWNRGISDDLRYVLVRVGADDRVSSVKVVNGDVLSDFDTTGTLTRKYQARLELGDLPAELVTHADTDLLTPMLCDGEIPLANVDPASTPVAGAVMPVQTVFDRISALVGREFDDAGHDQERNRGSAVHRAVCNLLGYQDYRDDGQYPDVRNQLLEVKLQTSPTIDLGRISPDSTAPLDGAVMDGVQIRHCDVRYAILAGVTDGERVSVTNLLVANGEDFYGRFPQFGGNVVNTKIQLRLPADFFDR